MKRVVGKKISFDFDDTLQREDIQNIVRLLKRWGNEVWIITRRRKSENKDVEEIASRVGIPLSKILYTEGKMKWNIIKDMDLDFHYDNKEEEVNLINRKTKTKGIKI